VKAAWKAVIQDKAAAHVNMLGRKVQKREEKQPLMKLKIYSLTLGT
jgi:hypothetical protein